MEWLSQNWLWVVLGIGALFVMHRGHQGGHGGCCGDMGHGGDRKAPEATGLPPKDTINSGAGHER